jgi:glycosyltransferase involved in cell wall biosynthesis
MRKLAEELGLQADRDYIGLGSVSAAELQTLYRNATLFVISTLYEAGSFPMREAMLQACPVVCSDIPPYVEEVDAVDGNALMFDSTDELALANSIRDVIEHPEAARTRALAAQRLVEGAFNWEKTARGYLAAFETAARA